ncbi:MAG: FHA domain-containing protein [Chloroflexi bacterium]|nr:FHA domain-containing protein [Chloroflexota bacterium]
MQQLQDGPVDLSPPPGFCPYVGLEAYTERDSDYFFGRERDERVLSANLYASRLTILYGASGVGKTSVLLAGLVPHLASTPSTATVVFREWQTDSFEDALKSACASAVERSAGKRVDADPSAPLDDLLFTLGQHLRGPITLLFDQFEEFFLYHPATNGGVSFDVELARVINREDVDASVLIVLREEGLASLDRFRIRIPNLLSNRLRLRHLDMRAAESAIRRPLDVYNARVDAARRVDIEDDLVLRLLADVRTGLDLLGDSRAGGAASQATAGAEQPEIETPFLQMVLTRLWDAEQASNSRTLRLSTYESLGAAERIVRTHLESALASLSRREKEAAAEAFRYLVTPSRTKISYSVSDLVQFTGLTPERLQPMLQQLAEGRARILREVQPVARSVEEQPEPRFEVFHDVLARPIEDWQKRFATNRARTRQTRRRFGVFAVALALLAAGYFLIYVPWQENQPWGYMQDLASGETYDLSGNLVRIGRNASDIKNDIDLRPQNVSRIHLMIFRDLTTDDLRSLYGTTINARFLPYGQTARLHDGDILAFSGEAALKFSSNLARGMNPSGAHAIVIDGTRRSILPLADGVNFLSLDASGGIQQAQSDPGDSIMTVTVEPSSDLGRRVSIMTPVTGIKLTAKIDDYNYPSYNLPPNNTYTVFPISNVSDPPYATRVAYRYGTTDFQLVDVTGN